MTEQEAREKLLELKLEQRKLEVELKTYPKPSKNQKYLNFDSEFKEYNECRNKLMSNNLKIAECKVLLKNDVVSDKNQLIHLKRIVANNFTIEQVKMIYKLIEDVDKTKSITFSTDKMSFKKELLSTLDELKSIRTSINNFMNESERIMNREDFGNTIKTMSAINKSVPTMLNINERISKCNKI